jgi:DNA-binding NtrC family response regulator
MRAVFCEVAESLGFFARGADGTAAARKLLSQNQVDILLLDVTRPESGNLPFFEQIRALHPEILIIAMSSGATIESAVDAMKSGVWDYLSKPFPLHVLTKSLQRAADRRYFDVERRELQENLQLGSGMDGILGRSEEMEKLYRMLSRVGGSDHPVMILGETGTGKALLARSIHANGPNATKPFVSLDCKTLGPALLEDELFGHPKSAFNETCTEKLGLLTSPQGGTLYLDEIADMPLDLQGKLARAIQDKEIRPFDGTQATPISVRILAATNRDLTEMVRTGLFRADLYRLLSVVNLRIPPLRGRPNDVVFLAKRYLERIHQKTGVKRTLSEETLRMLETYDWPDNVRELEESLTRACSRTSEPELRAVHLPQNLIDFHRKKEFEAMGHISEEKRADSTPTAEDGIVTMAFIEQQTILEAIRQTNGDKREAARLLGIGKTTLYRKLKEYGSEDSAKSPVQLHSSTNSMSSAVNNNSKQIYA